ncbi:hypothetical protein SAMN05421504_11615 [Amycolatopsis xylanica]|uniref:Uncharacterized protein n=1 Tax=Amycolatopsis xylanica TaxID=589385 RepID=A0A1H3SYT0_9PSEU|nr:hypothetical protein SAMN05421504_11615 [Amycolatopsis xylanica]
MRYLKCRWTHEDDDYPVWLFSELGPLGALQALGGTLTARSTSGGGRVVTLLRLTEQRYHSRRPIMPERGETLLRWVQQGLPSPAQASAGQRVVSV